MSKINDAVLQAEESIYSDEFHRAMDEWDYEKASKIVFHVVNVNGKQKLVNIK